MTDWTASPHEIIRKNAHAISQVENIMLDLNSYEAKKCIGHLQKGNITEAAWYAEAAEEEEAARGNLDGEEFASWAAVELNDNLEE